jgi:outer membrane biosynthesis protein TonB
MFGRSDTGIEMRTPALLSLGLHVFALVAAIVNIDLFSRPEVEPEPIMVDFEAIAPHAAAPVIGNPPPQPKDAKVDKETTKAPPPKTAEPPPAPEKPKPEEATAKPTPPAPVEKPKPKPEPAEDKIAMKPKEPEPPKVEKPPEPPKPKPKPEVKKVEPKPAPPKPHPPKPNVDNLVDSILKNQQSRTKIQTPEQQPKPVEQVTRQASMAPNLAAVVSASEIEGVRNKIRPCWNSFGGSKDAPIVTLVVQMNQDGTPVKAEVEDTGRYRSDSVFRAAADAAWRAVMNPRCQPWPLSPEKYNAWRTITFHFDPRDY